MKKLTQTAIAVMVIMVLSISPVMAKRTHSHKPHHKRHQVHSLQEYIHTLCKRSCVEAMVLNRVVKRVSTRYHVSNRLIMAVLKVESRFKRTANSKGNYGLMQINLRSHPEVQQHTIFDTETNINVGAQILSRCLDRSKNGLTKTLTCYKGSHSSEYHNEIKKTLVVLARLDY